MLEGEKSRDFEGQDEIDRQMRFGPGLKQNLLAGFHKWRIRLLQRNIVVLILRVGHGRQCNDKAGRNEAKNHCPRRRTHPLRKHHCEWNFERMEPNEMRKNSYVGAHGSFVIQ